MQNRGEKPILFSGETVRAILDERKTQTRRVIIPQPHLMAAAAYQIANWFARRRIRSLKGHEKVWTFWDAQSSPCDLKRCPFGMKGDRLWVKETFVIENTDEKPSGGVPYREDCDDCDFGRFLFPHYRATEPEPHIVDPEKQDNNWDDRTRWTSSRFMPRWASRIMLEVVKVRVERLQDISEEDAKAEGMPDQSDTTWQPLVENPPPPIPYTYRMTFEAIWDSLNDGRGFGWNQNPWVWVIDFKRINP